MFLFEFENENIFIAPNSFYCGLSCEQNNITELSVTMFV